MDSPFIKQGAIEVFTGPMAGGKSRRMLERISLIENVPDAKIELVKPELDNRSEGFYTRFGKLERDCLVIPADNPYLLFRHIRPEHSAVAIDDVQFFDPSIAQVIRELSFRNLDILVAGLDLDFKGDPFPSTKEILPYATSVYKGEAVCKYQDKCGMVASRTQRLIDGEPAPASSKLIIAGDENGSPEPKVTYVPRCVKHHFVPK